MGSISTVKTQSYSVFCGGVVEIAGGGPTQVWEQPRPDPDSLVHFLAQRETFGGSQMSVYGLPLVGLPFSPTARAAGQRWSQHEGATVGPVTIVRGPWL